jgi:hypothetical protein
LIGHLILLAVAGMIAQSNFEYVSHLEKKPADRGQLRDHAWRRKSLALQSCVNTQVTGEQLSLTELKNPLDDQLAQVREEDSWPILTKVWPESSLIS